MRTFRRFIGQVDRQVLPWMDTWGCPIERVLLCVLFCWFGILKIMGQSSATSIVAKTVYWFDPTLVVPILGVWELVIGLGLIVKPMIRWALLLLLIRLPGNLVALIVHFDTCFEGSIWLPSIQGQYLLKEMTLVGAAMVIAARVLFTPKVGQSSD